MTTYTAPTPPVRQASAFARFRNRPGLFLGIMILTLVVGDLQIPYYLANPEALDEIYSTVPSWFEAYTVVGLASNIAIIVGMVLMRRWAVALLGAYFISKFVVDAAYLLPEQRVAVFATSLIGMALWAWAIARQWRTFA